MKNLSLPAIVRPLLGILLIIFLVSQLDHSKLAEIIHTMSWAWLAFACVSLIISNLFSVARWQKITTQMGLVFHFKQALFLYAQGITANTVLPGGIVGGDVWRTLGLVKIAQQQNRQNIFRHAEAAASVLLDRVGGLWSLSLFSLATLIWVWFAKINAGLQSVSALSVMLYLAGLLLVALSPLFFSLHCLNQAKLQGMASEINNKWARKLIQTLGVIAGNIQLLLATLRLSLLVQVFAAFTLYCCLRAVGIDLSYMVVAAISFAIFLSAIIPASVSGFGARELASVAVMSLIGVNAEAAFSASFLFGLAGSLQGVIGVYFWLKREPHFT